MWYIFDKVGKCIAHINVEPSHDDLATRDERAVLSNESTDDLSRVTLVNDAVVIAPIPEPTPEEQEAALQARLTQAVQIYMNKTARERGYDGILSAISYADEPAVPQFQAEGQAYRCWRSQVWAKCYEILAAVKAGTRAVPTAEEVIAELPPLVLP